MEMERCKHGMVLVTCSTCQQQKRLEEIAKNLPKHRKETTTHGSAAVPAIEAQAFRLIRVHSKKGHPSLRELGPLVSTVHILGNPFLWLVEMILECAPNVKYIQTIPSLVAKFGRQHRELCAARGVQIIGGHVEPSLAWDEGEFRETELYKSQRRFIERLQGEQKKLFDELGGFGFEEVEFALYYFGLRGYQRKSQRTLWLEYGFCGNHVVSAWINTVIYYLDDSYKTGKISILHASALKKRVERLRQYLQSANSIDELYEKAKQEYGLDQIPVGIKPARLETLGQIWLAKKSGKLDRLLFKNERQHQALTLRFGIHPDYPAVYRTLQEVGDMMGGYTRERVRQLEECALPALGIFEEGVPKRQKKEKETEVTQETPPPPQTVQKPFVATEAQVAHFLKQDWFLDMLKDWERSMLRGK